MKVIIYVLCYDKDSVARATEEFAKYPWAKVVLLPDDCASSKFMEGAAYLHTLPNHREEWEDADFVGTLSWKCMEKIRIPDDLVASLVAARKQEVDVVALLPSTEHMVRQAVRSHPRFLEVWLPLLQQMGYASHEAVHADIPCMLCNYWVATPSRMSHFLDFYKAATVALETLTDGPREALWSDAGYATQLPIERRMEIYGTPYIPYHPFIGERLAGLFFWKADARVAFMSLGRRSFWEHHYSWEAEDVIQRAHHLTQTFHLT